MFPFGPGLTLDTCSCERIAKHGVSSHGSRTGTRVNNSSNLRSSYCQNLFEATGSSPAKVVCTPTESCPRHSECITWKLVADFYEHNFTPRRREAPYRIAIPSEGIPSGSNILSQNYADCYLCYVKCSNRSWRIC